MGCLPRTSAGAVTSDARSSRAHSNLIIIGRSDRACMTFRACCRPIPPPAFARPRNVASRTYGHRNNATAGSLLRPALKSAEASGMVIVNAIAWGVGRCVKPAVAETTLRTRCGGAWRGDVGFWAYTATGCGSGCVGPGWLWCKRLGATGGAFAHASVRSRIVDFRGSYRLRSWAGLHPRAGAGSAAPSRSSRAGKSRRRATRSIAANGGRSIAIPNSRFFSNRSKSPTRRSRRRPPLTNRRGR